MLIGVAKKLAGEFFTGVDEVLTGSRPAAAPAQPPAGTARRRCRSAGSLRAAVFTAPGRPARGRAPDSFLAGAVFGAATALLGVLVGARTARLNRRSS